MAGRKPGRQYLYRPCELLASDRDLERNGYELDRILKEDFGAVEASELPSRLSCRDPALVLIERDPQNSVVQAACKMLARKPKGNALATLRQRVESNFTRLGSRDKARRAAAKRVLDEQQITMLLLPASAPAVPRILKRLRQERDRAATHVWPNHVFGTLQDLFWVPAIPAIRLTDRPLPASPAGSAGQGVKVAVVDTGVRSAHEWLGAAMIRDDDYEELDEDRDLVLDYEAGHGTFVAGVVRQHAPGATIVGRAAFDTDGWTDDVRLGAALDSLRNECIDIVNLSVGGPAAREAPPVITRNAIDRLRRENSRLVVVAGAGNRNRSDPFYPAAFPDVIAVGALDQYLRRAAFSNYGPWVNAWALGVDVESSYVGTDVTVSKDDDPGGADGARWSGTSFAAPRVAGAIAAAMRPAS